VTTLAGKTVLVTGAASGMGAACAELAAAKGARVVGVDRDREGLEQLAERTGAHHEVCDLADVDAPALVRRCYEVTGGIDGLVNAAGVFQTRELLEITPGDFDRMFAINVRALFFLQQAAAREMAKRGGGSIVNFASTAARVPRPVSSHYAASKAAVVSFSRSAGAALAKYGVRVNAVCPGVVETPMIEAIRRERAQLFDTPAAETDASWRDAHPMGRLGLPREVAEVVVFLLTDAAAYVNGESIGVNGGTDDL
jgi:NAD(P)-dependent dehydrogenase (short-subunit alcohol dehydrogenase family)